MKLKLSGFESSLIPLCSPLMDRVELTLPSTNSDWKTWLDLAVLNRVETQIFKSCERRHIRLPDFVHSALEKRALQIDSQNKKRRKEAETLFQMLEQEKVPVVVLKGNALSEELYRDPDYKQMNDFDLLFRYDDLGRLLTVYNNLGYVSAASLTADFRKQEKYSHHWPPFFSRNMNLFLGTHWNLVSPFSDVKIPEEILWQNLETFSSEGQRRFRLSKENFLLHLCVHLSPFKLGLKELADLYNFIFFYHDQIKWPQFYELVSKTNAQDSVYRAFSILQSLFDYALIDKTVEFVRPLTSSSILQEVSHRTNPAVKFLHLRTAHVSKIEKNFGFFSLSDSPLEKAYFLFKMWKGYLWPPSDECFRLCHEIPEPSLKKRFLYSFLAIRKITKSFVHELGATVFIVVTIGHHVELTKAILRKLMGKPCYGIAKKAQKLGLPISDLKALSQLE